MTIQPIVEGPGDEKSVPILLRRLGAELLDEPCVNVGHPMLLPRGKMLREADVRRHLRIAAGLPGVSCILLFIDEDDDCCRKLNELIKPWAETEGLAVPLEIVGIPKEFESIFLSALESLRGVRGISANAQSVINACTVRDAKGRLSDVMEGSRRYSETADQPALMAKVDLAQVVARHSCVARLVAKLHNLK